MLVNRDPEICRRYHYLRDSQSTVWGRIYAWLELLKMNAVRWLGIMPARRYPIDKCESLISQKEPPAGLAKYLSRFDIISFDVFDTLVFRPFSDPTDLFYIVGERLGYLDFKQIRIEMEEKARDIHRRQYGHGEVMLEDIYSVMEEFVGIPKERGMRIEIEVEEELCFANPYIKEVLNRINDIRSKKIIATTDMYLPSEVINRILNNCGYTDCSEIYVSGEYGKSKREGTLYDVISTRMGRGHTYIHIGDNKTSDVRMAIRKGWEAVHYQNVNAVGNQFRPFNMSVITGSLYRGFVNVHLHNGTTEYDKGYELGYIYGGPFVTGYCRFIHQQAGKNNVDKILFFSRDGDIINQVYSLLYPEETDAGRIRYVYWSRAAATKMSAEYFKYDYFRRFIFHKVNRNYRLEEVFESMELIDMLPGLLKELKQERKLLDAASVLTGEAAVLIRNYLNRNWKMVLEHYKPQLEAGGDYFSSILQGCSKVCAVDVGWAGSGAVALNYLVNEKWHLNCEVVGLLAGTNSAHSAEADAGEPLLQKGRLVSYLFSQKENREYWKCHDAGKGDNLIYEKLLSSPTGSFKRFGGPGEEIIILQNISMEEKKQALQIQQGILAYAENLLNSKLDADYLDFSGADVDAIIRFGREELYHFFRIDPMSKEIGVS